MGKNLSQISTECGYRRWTEDEFKPNVIKKNMKYFPVPANQQWRVGLLQELLAENVQVQGFDEAEIKDLVDHLCVT